MKDNQLKKLTRQVRKLTAEVVALKKLIRRELRSDRKGKARKPGKRKVRATKEVPPPSTPPPAA